MVNKVICKRYTYWLFLIIIILLLGLRFILNNYINPINQKHLSPEETVNDYLLSRKDDIGTISLEIKQIKEIDKSHYISRMKNSKAWAENGWSKDNIAVVEAYYIAKYDHSKVPYNSGRLYQKFYLSRKNKNSPWTVHTSLSPSDY